MERKYEPYKKISCGCCTGDGTDYHANNDMCICPIHQDVPRGRQAHTCAHHQHAADEPITEVVRV